MSQMAPNTRPARPALFGSQDVLQKKDSWSTTLLELVESEAARFINLAMAAPGLPKRLAGFNRSLYTE